MLRGVIRTYPVDKISTCLWCNNTFLSKKKDAQYCPEPCRKEHQLHYYNARRKNSIEGTLSSVVASCRSRAKRKNMACDIDYQYMIKLYYKQNKRCAQTNVVLTSSSVNSRLNTNPNTISIDRVDSTKGYTKDNVELVSTIYNTAKNNWNKQAVLDMAKALCGAS